MCVTLSVYFLFFAAFFVNTMEASKDPGSLVSRLAEAVLAADDSGKPLFLTPLIDAGNLSEAKNLSRVSTLPLNTHVSYAGYLTVNRTAKSHLHFWFIPRTYRDGRRVPLILNLQESYAIFASLADNGPYRLDSWPQLRDYPWTDNYNMLYLDTIIGMGYSFSEGGGFIGSHFDVAKYTYEALQQFYKLFPEFRQDDLYIAGDAGTFIPAAGYKIHTANQEAEEGAFKMPLKGIMIGNGVSDLEETKIFYATYLRSIGLIDRHEQQQLEGILRRIRSALYSGNWTLAADWDAKLNATLRGMIGGVSWYDYTRDMSHIVDFVHTLAKFVTQKAVRKCMHVGWIKFNPNATAAAKALQESFGRPVRSMIEELLQQRYRVLFYNGQFDISSSHLMTSNFLSSLHWPGAHEYDVAKKKMWYSDRRKSIAGYYTTAKNLLFIMVRNAGHLASADQPENVLRMIGAFTANPSLLLDE